MPANSPYEADFGPDDRCYECGAPLPELVPRVAAGAYDVNSFCCQSCGDINMRRSGAGPGYNKLATLPVADWPVVPAPFVRCICGRERRARTIGVRTPNESDCPECYLPLRKGTS